MARFERNQPIDTREPTIVVDPGLAVGRHRFQLEVFDGAGNRSRPDTAVVEIRRLEPTGPVGPVGPVVDPVGPVVGPGPIVSPGPVVDPVGPVGPSTPVTPVRPGAPVTPAGPLRPTEPVRPIRATPPRPPDDVPRGRDPAGGADKPKPRGRRKKKE